MGSSLFESQVGGALDSALQRQEGTSSADRSSASGQIPLDKSPGFSLINVALGTLPLNGAQPMGLRGYGCIYISELSTTGAILLVDGSYPLVPGSRFDGYFENLSLGLSPASALASGNAALLIRNRPDADWREPFVGAMGSGAGATLLYDSNNFGGLPNTVLQGQEFIGSDGSVSVTASAVPAFNLSGFRKVRADMNFTALTGGSTPTASLALWGYPTLTDTSFAESFVATPGVGAAGGQQTMVLGDGLPNFTGSLGNVIALPTVATFNQPLFGRLQVPATGSPTGWTSPRILLYGIK